MKSEAGFTILEAVIALLVASIAITALVDAQQQAIRVESAASRGLLATRDLILAQAAFRQSANALRPSSAFSGDATSWQGLTTSYDGTGARALSVTWRLSDNALEMRDGDREWSKIIDVGPDASFTYLDTRGKAYGSWSNGPLPRAIALGGVSGSHTIIAAVRGGDAR